MFTQLFIKLFHSVQDRTILTFSEFEPRQRLGQSQTTLDIGQSVGITAYAKFYQNIPNGLRFIDIFHEQACVKIFTNCPVTKS